jgi:beta-glucosidase
MPEAKGAHDFVALQYYTTDLVRFDLSNPGEMFGRRSFPPGAEVDEAGYYASYPPGFMAALRWVRRLGRPIYVTECGIGDEGDDLRRRFLVAHLRELWRAVNFNGDVRGFFHWTLVDNFEWDRGWTHRFGLYALDPDTQVRTARPSAALYSEVARTGTLSSDMVSRYAPAVLARMFPG